MRVKAFVRLCLSVMVCALLLLAAAPSSKWEPRHNSSLEPREDREKDLPGGYQLFKADEFTFSFFCLSDWEIKREPFCETDGSLSTILVRGNYHETVSIKVFNHPGDSPG